MFMKYLQFFPYIGAVEWKLPSQTVLVQDSLVREVISPEMLERHLGLHYVEREVSTMLNPLLVRSLGVESITSDHLVQIGRSLVAQWNDVVSPGKLFFLSSQFVD